MWGDSNDNTPLDNEEYKRITTTNNKITQTSSKIKSIRKCYLEKRNWVWS
jgi:hypothetical protein